MASWSKRKVDASEINKGQEYTKDDNVSVEELNAIVNNSFNAQATAQKSLNTVEGFQIGTAIAGETAEATINVDSTGEKIILNLVLPKGEKGDKGDKGDSGSFGTMDYLELSNKPTINGVEVSGSLTTKDLGIETISQEQLDGKVDKIEGKGLSTNDFTALEKNKLETLENYDDTEIKKSINDLGTNKANSVDVANTYATKSELSTVEGNIPTDAVRYKTTQILTDSQKEVARTNIGASDFSGDYNDLTNKPTIPNVYAGTLTIQKNGTQLGTFGANQSTNSTINITVPTNYADVKALPNYSITINHQTGGNPRHVKFLTVNYSNYTSSSAAYFKLGAMSCHGNGTSYQFLEDIIIGVTSGGTIVCNVYKYCQIAGETVDGIKTYYGDVYYVVDTTNKIVDFYILCGQWAASQFTPFTVIGATTSSGITQYSGTATYYSSGTKVWANGNGSTYARTSEIPTDYLNRMTTNTASVDGVNVTKHFYSFYKPNEEISTTSVISYEYGEVMVDNSGDLTSNPGLFNKAGLMSVADKIKLDGLPSSLSDYIPQGGTLSKPLTVTGGDSATAGKIILTENGQITDAGTATLFGRSGGNLIVGHTSLPTTIRGKASRPTYNGTNIALSSDVPTNNNQLTNGANYATKTEVSKLGTSKWNVSQDSNGNLVFTYS